MKKLWITWRHKAESDKRVSVGAVFIITFLFTKNILWLEGRDTDICIRIAAFVGLSASLITLLLRSRKETPFSLLLWLLAADYFIFNNYWDDTFSVLYMITHTFLFYGLLVATAIASGFQVKKWMTDKENPENKMKGGLLLIISVFAVVFYFMVMRN